MSFIASTKRLRYSNLGHQGGVTAEQAATTRPATSSLGTSMWGGLQYGISKDHGSLSGRLFQFMQVSIMDITSKDPDEQDL